MNGHITGLLAIIAVQLGAIFADQTTPLPAKLAAAVGTLFTLLIADPATQKKATVVLLAVIGLAVPILAFALTKMQPGTLAVNILTTAVAVFVRLQSLLPTTVADSQTRPGGPPAAVLVLVGLSALLFSGVARADGLVLELSPNTKCSPVGMLTGYQLNLKTGDFQKGVGLGFGYGCRYTGWKVPLSVDIVGGAALNSNAPNAGQISLIFVADDNYGFGPGTQIFKDPVDHSYTGQMLVSLFLTGSWAATIDKLDKAKASARAEGAARAGAGQ